MRIIAASTAFAFAAVLGIVACVDGREGHGLVFRWRWVALVWMSLGGAAGWFLWQAVWAADAASQKPFRRRLFLYLLLLALGGFAVFLFPIIYVPAAQFGDVLTGLVAAILVLSFVGFMIHWLVRLLDGSASGDPARGSADDPS